MYHYAGNNPVRYLDPDGRDIKNSTSKYIIARLEKPMHKNTDNEIDTLIIPPYSVAYGAFDGARDEDGNYYKITGHELLPKIDFEIDSESNLKLGDFPKSLNDLGDKHKEKKNLKLPETDKLILSGKKIDGMSLDYEKLKRKWDNTFIRDVGDVFLKEIGNSELWALKYKDDKQLELRKKYKIKTFEEIKKFDKLMHDAHIY